MVKRSHGSRSHQLAAQTRGITTFGCALYKLAGFRPGSPPRPSHLSSLLFFRLAIATSLSARPPPLPPLRRWESANAKRWKTLWGVRRLTPLLPDFYGTATRCKCVREVTSHRAYVQLLLVGLVRVVSARRGLALLAESQTRRKCQVCALTYLSRRAKHSSRKGCKG